MEQLSHPSVRRFSLELDARYDEKSVHLFYHLDDSALTRSYNLFELSNCIIRDVKANGSLENISIVSSPELIGKLEEVLGNLHSLAADKSTRGVTHSQMFGESFPPDGIDGDDYVKLFEYVSALRQTLDVEARHATIPHPLFDGDWSGIESVDDAGDDYINSER